MAAPGITVRSTPEAVAFIDELATTVNGPLLTHFDDVQLDKLKTRLSEIQAEIVSAG